MIKAKNTLYNGILFRSRLEARWAVFMDSCGIEYKYENEGYYFNGYSYLPDFYIPTLDLFFEVKGSKKMITQKYSDMILSFVSEIKKNLVVMFDIPKSFNNGSIDFPETEMFFYCEGQESGWDNNYQWCVCDDCGFIGIEFDGRSERLKCGCQKDDSGGKTYTLEHPIFLKAYMDASSARFEYGETGKMV